MRKVVSNFAYWITDFLSLPTVMSNFMATFRQQLVSCPLTNRWHNRLLKIQMVQKIFELFIHKVKRSKLSKELFTFILKSNFEDSPPSSLLPFHHYFVRTQEKSHNVASFILFYDFYLREMQLHRAHGGVVRRWASSLKFSFHYISIQLMEM